MQFRLYISGGGEVILTRSWADWDRSSYEYVSGGGTVPEASSPIGRIQKGLLCFTGTQSCGGPGHGCFAVGVVVIVP